MAAAKTSFLSSVEVFGVGVQVTSIACLRPQTDESAAVAIAGTLDGAARLFHMPSKADVAIARGVPGAKRQGSGPPMAMRSAVTVGVDMALPGVPTRIGGVSAGPLRADGTMTALTASNDAIVRLWHLGDYESATAQAALARKESPSDPDIPVGELVHELKAHSMGCQAVTCLSTSRVVSGGFEGSLVQWDAETGEAVQTLDAGAPIIAVCEASRPGTTPTQATAAPGTDSASRLVVVALAEGPVSLYDVRGGGSNRRVASLGSHGAQQCNTVADAGAGLIVSGGCDGTMRVWDCRRLDVMLRESSPSASVPCAASASTGAGGILAAASAAAKSSGGGSGSMAAAMARAKGARGGAGKPGDPAPSKMSDARDATESATMLAEASFDEEWVYGVSTWQQRGADRDSESTPQRVWSGSADGTARCWRISSEPSDALSSPSSPSSATLSGESIDAGALEQEQLWGLLGGPSWICIGSMSDSTALGSLAGGSLKMLFA